MRVKLEIRSSNVPSIKKIPVIKAIKNVTDLGLKEAKELVDRSDVEWVLVSESLTFEQFNQFRDSISDSGFLVAGTDMDGAEAIPSESVHFFMTKDVACDLIKFVFNYRGAQDVAKLKKNIVEQLVNNKGKQVIE